MPPLQRLLFTIAPMAGFLLLFGGPWTRFMLGGALLFGAVFHLDRAHRQGHLPPMPPGMIPLALWAGFIVLQLVPLPPALIGIVVPQTWALYRETVWLVDPGALMPISVRPKATLLELFALVSAICLYVLAAGWLADRDRLQHIFLSLVLFVSALTTAVLAAPWVLPGRFRVALVDPVFLGALAVLLAPALALCLAVRVERGGRRGFSAALRSPRAHPHVPVAVAVLVLLAAVVMHATFAWQFGVGAALLGCAFVLLLRATRRKDALRFFALFGVLAAGVAAWNSPGALTRQALDYVRAAGDAMLLDAASRHRFTGTGVGTFVELSHLRTVDSSGGVLILALEGGAPVLLFSATFVLALLVGIRPRWKSVHGRLPLYLSMGALAGILTLLTASVNENVLFRGPLLYLFFFLAASAVAAVRVPSRREWAAPSAARPVKHPRVAMTLATLLACAYAVFHLCMGAAALQMRGDESDMEGRLRSAGVAMLLDPLEDGYRHHRGALYATMGNAEAAERSFVQALRRSPLRAEYLYDVGEILAARGEIETGSRLLQEGFERGLQDGSRNLDYIERLIAAGEWERTRRGVRKMLRERPSETSGCLALLHGHGIAAEDLGAFLPDDSRSHVAYAAFLLKEERLQLAAETFLAALRLLDAEVAPQASVALEILNHFDQMRDREGALEGLRIALGVFPDSVELRREAVRIYDEAGLTFRSEAERRTLQMLQSKETRRGWFR